MTKRSLFWMAMVAALAFAGTAFAFTLTVSVRTPGGTYTLEPLPGSDGGYAPGTAVTVHFIREQGDYFAFWCSESSAEGERTLQSSSRDLQLVMDRDRVVKAWFCLYTGMEPGVQVKTVAANMPILLFANTNGPFPRDQVTGEWLLVAQIIGGVQSPVYLVTTSGVVPYDFGIPSVDDVFPFDSRNPATGRLQLASPKYPEELGLMSPGDTLAYAYACTGSNGSFILNNITIITLQ